MKNNTIFKIIVTLLLGLLFSFTSFENIKAQNNTYDIKVSVINGNTQARQNKITLLLYEVNGNDLVLKDTKVSDNNGLVNFTIKNKLNYRIVMADNDNFVPGKDINFIIKDLDPNEEYYLDECGNLTKGFSESMIAYPVPVIYPVTKAFPASTQWQEIPSGMEIEKLPKDFNSYRVFNIYMYYQTNKTVNTTKFNRVDSIKYIENGNEITLVNNVDYTYEVNSNITIPNPDNGQPMEAIAVKFSFAPSFIKNLTINDYSKGYIKIDSYLDVLAKVTGMNLAYTYQKIENQYGKEYPANSIYTPDYNVWEKPNIVEPCEIGEPEVIVPLQPELSEVACGIEPELILPQQDGVEYTYEKSGNQYLVNAKAKEGYVFAENATTSWQLIAEITPCIIEVTPQAPYLKDVACDLEPELVLPQQDGVEYSYSKEDGKYYVSAKAKEGYIFSDGAQSEWELTINVTECVKPPVTEKPQPPAPEKPNPTKPVIPNTGSMDLASSLISVLLLINLLIIGFLSRKRKVN